MCDVCMHHLQPLRNSQFNACRLLPLASATLWMCAWVRSMALVLFQYWSLLRSPAHLMYCI